MNIKLRFQNKATLAALIAAAVAFAYQILGILGVAAPVSQDNVIQIVGVFLNLLVALGVLVDPTTQGVSDSALSMNKSRPESVETQLVANMPSNTTTCGDDAEADPNISDEATKFIKHLEEKQGGVK